MCRLFMHIIYCSRKGLHSLPQSRKYSLPAGAVVVTAGVLKGTLGVVEATGGLLDVVTGRLEVTLGVLDLRAGVPVCMHQDVTS